MKLQALLTLLFTVSALAAPLLPFQGHLTKSNGEVVDDGTKVVQFKIYDAPVSGNAVWAGEVHKLSVNKGLVNTILGTKTAFPPAYGSAVNAKVMFSEPLYIEITVDADSSGTITAADPPLLPRQVLLPANFAQVAHSVQTTDSEGNAVDVISNAGQIDGDYIASGSISSEAIGELSLDKLKNAETPDGGLSALQIGNDAIGTLELAGNAVWSENIQNGEVKEADIGGEVDDQGEVITPGAVTSAKIRNETIQGIDIALQSINPDRLGLNCAMFTEEKSRGPGSKAAGWTPRDLNKEQFKRGDSISLSQSGGVITLKEGIYWVEGSVPGFTGDRHVGKLERLSGETSGDLIGTGEYAASSGGGTAIRSLIRGYVTVNSESSTWRLNHYSNLPSANSNGLGVDTVGAPARVYAEVQIIKVK